MTGEFFVTLMNTRQLYVNSFSSPVIHTHTPGSKSNLLVEDALMEETDVSRGHTPLSPIGIRSAPLDWEDSTRVEQATCHLTNQCHQVSTIYYVPKPPVYIHPCA